MPWERIGRRVDVSLQPQTETDLGPRSKRHLNVLAVHVDHFALVGFAGRERVLREHTCLNDQALRLVPVEVYELQTHTVGAQLVHQGGNVVGQSGASGLRSQWGGIPVVGGNVKVP